MPVKIETMERVFSFKGEDLPDPDPQMSPTEVIEFYSAKYPELTAATVKETTEKDGKTVYSLEYSVGNKA